MNTRRGRPKLKLQVTSDTLKEIDDYFKQYDLLELEQDKLHTISLAAEGKLTCEEIAEKLGRSKSAVQSWIQRWREAEGNLEEYLRIRRRRVSPIRDKRIFDKLKAAYRAREISTGHGAARWLKEHFGLDATPQRMNYWLDRL